MQNLYSFPAVFYVDADGVSVEFPDLPGCLTCAETIDKALENATEAMHLHLYCMEIAGEEIPYPTPISEIQLEANATVSLIHAWMPLFRELMTRQAVSPNVAAETIA